MIRETTPRNSRVYMRIEDAGHGMMRLAFSLTPPSYDDPAAVLIARGVLPMGQPLSMLVVSDPTQDASLRGPAGKDGVNGVDGRNGNDGRNGVDGKAGVNGKDGAPGRAASAYLGDVVIGQTATVAVTVAAGARRVLVTIPAAMGVAAGDSLYLAPTQVLPGYVLSDVVAVDAGTLSVGLTGPALAVGASYKISCKLFRLNT